MPEQTIEPWDDARHRAALARLVRFIETDEQNLSAEHTAEALAALRAALAEIARLYRLGVPLLEQQKGRDG